jgi:VPDSG-CTERM motif
MTTRKHVFYGILALVSLLGLGITQSARADLITNGGFETGDFSGWTVSGTDNDVVGSVPFVSPHSGNYQALFGINNNSITSQNVATTPGSSYVVSFWLAAKIYSQAPGSFSLNWGGSTVFSHLFQSGLYGSTEYTFTVNALSPTTALQFQFSDPQFTSDTFYLDDVSVNPVSVPDGGSTVSLFGFALLGVAVLRRKLAAKALVVS